MVVMMMMMMPILVGVSSKDSFFLSLCFGLHFVHVMFQTYTTHYNAEESENRKFICFNTIVDATVVLFLLFLSTISRALYLRFVYVLFFFTLDFCFVFLVIVEPLGFSLRFELFDLRTINWDEKLPNCIILHLNELSQYIKNEINASLKLQIKKNQKRWKNWEKFSERKKMVKVHFTDVSFIKRSRTETRSSVVLWNLRPSFYCIQ